MRNPLQARLPPVSPCHRSPHLANDDTPVTTTHDRVGHNKTKRSTVLNVQQSVGSVRLPPNPVLRPLSPELARRDGPHHTNVQHVVPRRFFIPEMVSCLAGTTVFELEKVVRLEISEDMRDMGGVECIGKLLPALEHLVLDDGRLSSLYHLGTNLTGLRSLSAARVGLRDLHGVGALSGLTELHLPGNHISDVTPLACNQSISMLDLSSNLITNISTVDLLGSCPSLVALNLYGNPLTEIMKEVMPLSIARRVVCSSLPRLKRLDEINVTPEDFFTGEYGGDETLSWAREVISNEVDKISIEGASGPLPVSSIDRPSSYNDKQHTRGHNALNNTLIAAALRRRQYLGIEEELHKEEETTLGPPPVSSLIDFFNDKCYRAQGRTTLTGTPSSSLRRKKYEETKVELNDDVEEGGEEVLKSTATTGNTHGAGLSCDSELTRGQETLTGTPTAALRRRKRLESAESSNVNEVARKASDLQDGALKLGVLEILDLAKAMDAPTEKGESKITDPVLEQILCQWHKDVMEEFDDQVLPWPSAKIIHLDRSSKDRIRRRQPSITMGCPVPPDLLRRRNKHLSIVRVEDEEDLEPPESVFPLPMLEEFISRGHRHRRYGEIGRRSSTTTTCESHISAQRRARRSLWRELGSSKPRGDLHKVDSCGSDEASSDISTKDESGGLSASSGESISRAFSREALKRRSRNALKVYA